MVVMAIPLPPYWSCSETSVSEQIPFKNAFLQGFSPLWPALARKNARLEREPAGFPSKPTNLKQQELNMFPYLEVFGRTLGMYPMMAMFGVFASGIYSSVMSKKYKYDYTVTIIFMLFLSVGVVIGGHLLYALVTVTENRDLLLETTEGRDITHIISILVFIFGGSVFYGGLLGGLIAGWVCVKRNSVHANYIDIVAVSIPLFHFFGRIGCFFGGCCFGIESAFGFTFHHSPIEEANHVHRFPVQLLEASFNLALFFLLNYFLRNNLFKKRLAYIYLLIYSVGRFFIEFLRGDDYRGIWLFLSTSQVISVAVFLVVLIKLYTLRTASLKSSTAETI